MDEARALRAWAESQPVVAHRPATTEQIERHLEFLAATLPGKAIDAEAGRSRFAVYVTVLCRFPNHQLQYMARRIIETSNWFPTPKQCLDVLAEYREPMSEPALVLIQCDRFASEQLDVWLANVRDGQPLGDVPEQWLRIGVEQGYVRRLQDGSFVSRALFVGPTMAGKVAQPIN